MTADELIGTVYILHYHEAIGNKNNSRGQARHYTGFSVDVDKRLEEHRTGNYNGLPAKLPAAFLQAGIGFEIGRLYENVPQSFEYKLKRKYKNARLLCLVCKAEAERRNK